MALQDSVIQLKGKLGNLSFYKTKDGYQARKKGGISAERLKTDPAFARTRENLAEFGRAGLASKILRTAFRTVLLNNSDSKMSNRLTRELMKVLKMDTLNDRGQRKVTEGDLQLLNQFDFNDSAGLLKTFFAPFVPAIDRAMGKIDVDVAPFAPLNMLAFPDGATHFVLKAAAAEVDFENNQYVMNFSESNPIPLDSQMSPVLNLTQNVTAASTAPIFALFGIEFFQEVNNTQYPLKNGAFNAMAIVQIDQ